MDTPNLPFPETAQDGIHKAAEEASARAAKLKEDLDVAAKERDVWQAMIQYRDRGWWCHLHALFVHEAPFFHRLRAGDHPVVPQLEMLCRDALAKAEGIIIDMPRLMDTMATKHNLPLDRIRSRHPKYLFRDGFITVEIDDAKRSARVRDNESKLKELPADLEAIADALTREDARIFGRNFKGGAFLTTLHKAYLAILKKEKRPDGSPVPLRQIGRHLNVRMDEFVIDVSMIAAKGPLVADGFRFELQQTKDTDEGVLLHGPAGRGMVNLVLFRKETA